MEDIIQLALRQNNVEMLSLLAEHCSSDERLSLLLQTGLPVVCKHYGFTPTLTIRELMDFVSQKKVFTETKGSVNEKLILFTKERKSEYLLSVCLEAGANPLVGVKTAAEMGDVEFAKFFIVKGTDIKKDADICAMAARFGHFEFLKWVHAEEAPLSAETASESAHGGHLEILKWLRERECPFTGWCCVDAAIGGHLEVLQWLRANGYPWNEQVCASAARCRKFAVLKWAVENGCPCGEKYKHLLK